MKLIQRYLLLIILALSANLSYAQKGPRELDCVDAAVICGATNFIDSIDLSNLPSPLYGNTSDIPAGSSCWGSKQEVFQSWYQFNVGSSGTMEMSVTPLNGNAKDWDFILYDVTAGCGTGNWIEVACNNSGDCGITGISTIDSLSIAQCNPFATSPWNNTVWLDSGHIYALVINNAGDFDVSGYLIFEFAVNQNNLADAAEFLGLEASFTMNADTICEGGNLTVTNTSFGPGSLNYFWDFGNGVTSTAFDTTVQYNTAGTYPISLVVDNGVCPDTLYDTVYVVQLDAFGDTTVCEGETVMLWAIGGGTYSWSPGGLTGDTVFVTANSTTNYSVTITNESCSSVEQVVVTVNPLPAVSITENGSNPVCPNDSLELIANPNGMTSYQWYLNGVAIAGATGTNLFVNTAGTYDIGVVDANGCTDTTSAEVTVTLSTLPTVTTVTGGAVYCDGDGIGDILVNVTGTGPWTVDYTLNGVPASASGGASPVSLGNAAGVYVVTGITDANCSNTASGTQTITVNPLPTVTSVDGGADYCVGDVVSNITVDVTGTGPWTVDYTLNGVPASVGGATSPISLGNAAGVYVVTGITDVNCNNTASGTQTITINPLPTVTSVTGGGVYCAGDGIGDILVNVTGTGPWTVDYTLNGVPASASGGASPVSLGNAAGVYVVTGITDALCDNTASGTQTITVNPLPTVTSVDGGADYCVGDVVGNITVDVTGTGPWTVDYTLNGVPASVGGATSPISLGNAAGVYVVTGVADVNCTNTASGTQTITINPLPTVTSVTGGGVYCAGDGIGDILVNVTGTGPWTIDYTLNGAPTSVTSGSNPVNLGNTTGVYVITGITDALCDNTASGTQTITVNPLPTVTSVNGGADYCVGDVVGNITVDVTGTGSWTVDYTLNGVPASASGATSPISLGNAAGVYVVTGVEDVNCTNTASGTQTITINPLPTVTSVTGGGVYCAGDGIGDILVDVTGTGPWTIDYTLDGVPTTASGATSPISLGNAAGVYEVTGVTDALCANTASGTQTITINPLPSVSTISGGATYCVGDVVADVCVNVTGTGPWTINYTLDGVPASISSATSPICLGNAAGIYEVIDVADANCTNIVTLLDTITINPLPVVSINTLSGALTCFGDTMLLQAQPAGVSYQWYFNGSIILGATSQLHSNINPGIYNVIVTDANGCSDSAAVGIELIVNPLPVVNLNLLGSNPICDGDTTSIEAISGGAVSFQWLLNGNPIGPDNAILDITAAGCYNVSVTDTNTCVDTASTAICINVNALPVVTITPDQSNYCFGDTAVLTANGGGVVSYQWYFEGVLMGGETNSTLITNVEGTYNVMVVDTNGCSDSASVSFVLQQNPLPVVTINQIGGNPICFGDTLCLLAVSGGAVSYDWLLDGVSQGLFSPNICIATPGLWNVSVTDTNGCVDTAAAPVDLVVNPLPVITINLLGPATICEGDTTVLEALASGAATYQWYLDGGVLTGETGSTIAVTLDGCYNVAITDTNGCVDTASAPVCITVKTAPVITITSDQPNYCIGDTAILTANGGGIVAYQWYVDGVLLAGATGQTLSTFTNGNYNVMVVDTNGCSDTSSASFNLQFTPLPDVGIIEIGSNPLCANDTLILEATLLSGAFPDPTAYNYQWYIDGVLQPAGTNQQIQVTTSGVYLVYMEDKFGSQCGDTASIRVVVHPIPVVSVSLSTNDTICAGETATITALPAGAVSYQWFNGITPIGGNTQSIDVSVSGNYNVVVTDTNGCSDTASSDINLLVDPLPVAAIIGSNRLCYEGDTLLLIGSGGSSYQWLYNGVNTGLTNDSIIVDTVGTYQVIAINLANCVDTSAFHVVSTDSIEFTVLSADTGVCPGQPITLSVLDNPAYTFTWSPTGDNGTSTSDNPTDSTTYIVTADNGTGCTRSESIQVDVFPLPPADAGTDTSMCLGDDITLFATGGVSYSWSNGSNADTAAVSPSVPTDYIVEVTDTNGCVASDTVNVVPLPQAFVSDGDKTCGGDSVTLTASGGGTYLWSTGDTTSTIVITTNVDTTFTVLIENMGCTKTLASFVEVVPDPLIAYESGDTLICISDLIGKIYTISGDSNLTYEWSGTGYDSLFANGDSAVVNWSADTSIDRQLVVTVMNEDSCTNTLVFDVGFDERELWLTVVTDDFDVEKDVHIMWGASAKDRDRDRLALWRRGVLPDTTGWVLLDTVGMFDSIYTDFGRATSDSSFQYKLVTTNICGDPLETLPHNTVWLRGTGDEVNESVMLYWNRYENWRDSVYEYRIYRKVDNQTYLEVYDAVYTDTTITFNNAHDGFIHTYRVLAVENNEQRNIVSWSNEVVIDFRHPIHIHNIFSPNGDGVNETFFIDNIGMWPDNEVWIFNRWGNEVFHQAKYDNSWNGGNLPTGTYYYIVEVEEADGRNKYKDALMITR